MNPNKLILALLVVSPSFDMASCMSPSRRARKKVAATHLWKSQEKMINDQLAAEEYKVNKDIKESKRMSAVGRTFGFPKTMKDKRVGLYGQMDLIRE